MVGSQGKRVRACGLRHSWGNIFADEGQFLISMYPRELIGQKSHVIEDYFKEVIKSKAYDHVGSLLEMTIVEKIRDSNCTLVRVGASVSN
ncbi:unnamed protein product [Sphagnum balticum]